MGRNRCSGRAIATLAGLMMAGCSSAGLGLNGNTMGNLDPRTPGVAAQIVHDGGIVYATRHVLTGDLLEGYSLVSPNGSKYAVASAYQVQATYGGLLGSQESQEPDGSWLYLLAESSSSLEIVQSRVRNQGTSTSFTVPDADVLNDLALVVEATESVPAGAPAGAVAYRYGIDLKKSTLAVSGTLAEHRVYVPGSPTHEYWQQLVSRSLTLVLPSVPALDGQPLTYERTNSDYLPEPSGNDVPLTVVEDASLPDGMVIQQTTTTQADLTADEVVGTLTLPDSTSLTYDRMADLVSDAATESVTVGGYVVHLIYGTGRIFSGGDVQDAHGARLATLSPGTGNAVLLIYPDGSQETVTPD